MPVEIDYLADRPEFLRRLAEWHFAQWNQLTGVDSVETQMQILRSHSNRRVIPCVLVAFEKGELRGSASIIENDMETRPELTPWMSFVYVDPSFRRRGIASELVRRIVLEAKELKVPKLYLFTTGPWRERLYANLGWSVEERPIYRGIERVVMSIRP